MARFSGHVSEPCTLVYTLLDDSKINFNEFYLAIRSIHSHNVDSFNPNAELKQVHVKVNYQANVANATARLGRLASIVGVTKLSSYIKEDEFVLLEQLRRRWGIGGVIPDNDGYHPTPRVPTTTTRGRARTTTGKSRRRIFPSRPAPYQLHETTDAPATIRNPPSPVATECGEETQDYEDSQVFPGQTQPYEFLS